MAGIALYIYAAIMYLVGFLLIPFYFIMDFLG